MEKTLTPNNNFVQDRSKAIKNQLLDSSMIFIAILLTPGFVATAYQMYDHGFPKIMIIHNCAFFCYLGITMFSRFFDYSFKLIATLALWMLVGITGFFSWKLMAFALPVLLAASFFGTLFSGIRFGIFSIGVTLITIIMVRIASENQWIDYPQALKPYILWHSTWIIAIACVLSLGGVVVFALGKLQKEYFLALNALDTKNQNLKNSEKRLKESELQYNYLFENMLDAFAVHELMVDEKNQPINYRYLLANPAFETMIGLKSDQLIGKTAVDVLPKIEPYWIQTYGQVALTGSPIKFENYSTDLDRYFEICAYCPAPGQFACIFKDITRRKKAEDERKELENQLRQSHKMEALGTLAGGLAHDFNNFLMPVMGYTEMLIEDYSDNEDILSSLQEILKAAKRGKQLAEKVLTFSRRSNQQCTATCLEEIVSETLPLLRASIPTTIEIIDHIEKNGHMVMGDPVQLQQIIMNLSTNAYHAMEEGSGRITISLQSETIDKQILLWDGNYLIKGDYIKLTIEDDGHGIDEETQEKIFDPYFTTKEKGKGTGLGLSVVLGIVNRLNGGIKLTTSVGKGTCFDIYFPLIKSKERFSTPDNNGTIEPGVETILLVDDEESILDVEKKLLTRLGYQVTACLNGMEAKKIFENNPNAFDLIITDFTMPNLTGVQLADQLIQIRPDIPVILCTGYSEEQFFISKDQGIKAMLTKPILKKELARVIRNVIDQQQSNESE